MLRSLHAPQLALILAVGYLVFFHRLGDLPIYVWDEARNAANALEMLRTGDLLVTRYYGQPDLWNTKPPVAIWLSAASMGLFGVSEFALRLPSAAAALGTALIVYGFTTRVADSRWTGLLAALALMSTAGYVGPHIARTADYDALLALFTTAQAVAFYLAVERSEATGRPAPPWLLAFGLAGALALLAKGVAGALLLPGCALFAVLRGKLGVLARSPAAWGAAALLAGPPAAYYLLREAAAAGYLAAVAANELGGRFAAPLDGHQAPWHYYLSELTGAWPRWLRWPTAGAQVWGSAFPWSWLLPFSALAALTAARAPVRRATLFLVLLIVSYLLIVSSAQTKLNWYLAPLFPLIAVVTALGAHRIWEALAAGLIPAPQAARRALPALTFAAAGLLAVGVAYKNIREIESSPWQPERMTQALIRQASAAHPNLSPLRIVHDGHGWQGGRPYVAPEEFYATALRRRGLDVRVVGSEYAPRAGETLLWCAMWSKRRLAVEGEVLLRNDHCRAVRLPPPVIASASG